MNDLHNNIKISRAVSPVVITAGDATLTSEIIDRANFGSLEYVFISGAITDGTFTITIYESDDSGMSGEVAVADADLIGTEMAFVGATAADDNTTKKVGYKGSKRYTRAKIVQTGATTGGYIAAVAIQGHPRVTPVA
jgi:hypothetical protein